MLVLTRKIDQGIIVDGCVRITVTAIKGERVRIGIEAPPDVRVFREELLQRSGERGYRLEREAGCSIGRKPDSSDRATDNAFV